MFIKIKNWAVTAMERNMLGGFNVTVEDNHGYESKFDYLEITAKYYWVAGYKCDMPKYLQTGILELAANKGWRAEQVEVAASKVSDLTTNEGTVLDFLINTGWYAEEGFSDIEVKDIAAYIGSSVASAKGFVGSLCKKGYLVVSDREGDVPPLVYAGSKLTYNDNLGKYEY